MTAPPDYVIVSSKSGTATSTDVKVISYKEVPGLPASKVPVPLVASYSLDGKRFYEYGDPSMPFPLNDYLDGDAVFSYNNNENNPGYTASIQLAAGTDMAITRTAALRGRQDVMSLNGAYDYSLSLHANLACYDPLSETFRSAPVTANSYIIRRPGKYAFPLVYGNGLDYTKNPASPHYNTGAYAPSGTSEDTFLTPFKNYANNDITAPWIHLDLGKTARELVDECEAVIIWQDVPSTEQFLHFSGTPIALYIDRDWDSDVVPYLQFEIDKDRIREGNVVVGIRKKASVDPAQPFLWSWHIWVTAEDLYTGSIPQSDGTDGELLSVPMGWFREGYPEKFFYVKLSQAEGPCEGESAPRVFSVYQMRNDNSGITYYQWGRKDPFLPAIGFNGPLNKVWSSPGGYEISGEPGVTEAASGAGDKINYSSSFTASASIRQPYIMFSHRPGIHNLWDATRTDADTTPNSFTALNKIPVKTVYDPCPPGFCVPRREIWRKVGSRYFVSYKGNNGWDEGLYMRCNDTDETEIFYPAAGHRDYVDSQAKNLESGLYYTALACNLNGDSAGARLMSVRSSFYLYGFLYSQNAACGVFPSREQ